MRMTVRSMVMPMIVIMVMMRMFMIVMVMVLLFRLQQGEAFSEQGCANQNDRNTGKDTHPWIEALRQDVFGKIQRNKSEREYADRMRQRNGGSKEYRVFARSARADEI